jgi:hypothetical protein
MEFKPGPSFVHGPFVVVVEDSTDSDAFPQCIGPFATREDANEFVAHWMNPADPLTHTLCLTVAVMRSASSFKQFMSW